MENGNPGEVGFASVREIDDFFQWRLKFTDPRWGDPQVRSDTTAKLLNRQGHTELILFVPDWIRQEVPLGSQRDDGRVRHMGSAHQRIRSLGSSISQK